MRPKRKRQALEDSEESGQRRPQDKNVKRRKIKAKEQKGEASNQAKKPRLDDAPLVPKRAKAQKRKRDESGERSAEKKMKTDLGNFTFHKVLGSGGYGKVLLATHNKTERKVAVKIASKKQIIKEDPQAAKIERKVLELVNGSPYFTHLHQCFHSKEHLFYVLEYIGRGSLMKLLEARGRLDTETIRLYAAELACAISYLHSKRVIHRDLKPDNILVGTDGHLKVADFGLSVILPKNRCQITGRAGTRGYMAPEMLAKKYYNFAADWFSYGAILYEMATGTEPFDSETSPAVTRKTLRCRPDYPEDMDSDLKDLLENLLIRNHRKRLGANNIRSHPFFRNINWADVEERRLDVPVYGDSEEEATTRETIDDVQDLFPQEYCNFYITPSKDKFFERFTFLSSSWRSS